MCLSLKVFSIIIEGSSKNTLDSRWSERAISTLRNPIFHNFAKVFSKSTLCFSLHARNLCISTYILHEYKFTDTCARTLPHALHTLILYSGKLSREKTFSRVSLYCAYQRKFSPRWFAGLVNSRQYKQTIHESFLHEIQFFHQFAKVFSLERFPLYSIRHMMCVRKLYVQTFVYIRVIRDIAHCVISKN